MTVGITQDCIMYAGPQMLTSATGAVTGKGREEQVVLSCLRLLQIVLNYLYIECLLRTSAGYAISYAIVN